MSYDLVNLYNFILKTAPEYYHDKVTTCSTEFQRETCLEIYNFSLFIKNYSEGSEFYASLLKYFRTFADENIKQIVYVCAFHYKLDNNYFEDACNTLREGMDEDSVKEIVKNQNTEFLKDNKFDDAILLTSYINDETYNNSIKELAVKYFYENHQYEKAIKLAQEVSERFDLPDLIRGAIRYYLEINWYTDALSISKFLSEDEAVFFEKEITQKAIEYYTCIKDFKSAIGWAKQTNNIELIKSKIKEAAVYWMSQNDYADTFNYAKGVLTEEEIFELCDNRIENLARDKNATYSILQFLLCVQQKKHKDLLASKAANILINKIPTEEFLYFCRETDQTELYKRVLRRRIKPIKFSILFLLFTVYFLLWMYISKTYASAFEACAPIIFMMFILCFCIQEYKSHEKFSKYSYYFLCRIYPVTTICLWICSFISFFVATLQILISVITFRIFAKIMPSKFTKEKYKN